MFQMPAMSKEFKVWPKSKSKGNENSPPPKALEFVLFCFVLGLVCVVYFHSHWFCEARMMICECLTVTYMNQASAYKSFSRDSQILNYSIVWQQESENWFKHYKIRF